MEHNFDEIYRLSNCDNIYVKSAAVFLPTLFQEKQAIILVHHLDNIDSNMEAANENYPHLKYKKYYNKLKYEERDLMRADFEQGLFKFLYATPNMYEWNTFFKDFVHNQIDGDNILIAL